MKIPDKWWTSPQEADNGKRIIITARDDMDPFAQSGKFSYRVEVDWNYNAKPDGFPESDDAALMEQITDALLQAFSKDPVAILTGIYTGDGQRNWIFYTKNLRIFGIVFNKALQDLDTVPLVIEAYEDPEWEQYYDIKEETYIPPED